MKMYCNECYRHYAIAMFCNYCISITLNYLLREAAALARPSTSPLRPSTTPSLRSTCGLTLHSRPRTLKYKLTNSDVFKTNRSKHIPQNHFSIMKALQIESHWGGALIILDLSDKFSTVLET